MVLDPSRFQIDWKPPDLTPGLSLLARSLQAKRADRRAEENTKIQRMFADAQLRRMDQESARHLAEFNARENEKMRKAEMDKAAFLERVPYLTRNPLLPAIAAQYGIQGQMVDEPAQQTAAPTTNPVLAAAMQSGAGVDTVSGDGGPPVQLGPDEEGPEQFPQSEEARFALASQGQPRTTVAPMVPVHAENLDDLGDAERRAIAENITSVGDRTTLASDRIVKIDDPFVIDEATPTEGGVMPAPEAPQSPTPVAAAPQAPTQLVAAPQVAAQAPAQAPRNKLFRAVIGGQQYDVGGQSPSTGLGEKYDALYSRYLQEPGGEKVAFAKTLAAWQAEQTSIAAGERAKEAAGSREQMAGQKEEFTRWLYENFHLTADQLMELRKRAIDAAKTASGNAPVPITLAPIIEKREAGAPLSEVTAEAAKAKIPAKTFQTAVGSVATQAALGERAGEKRAGLEINDMKGNFLGYAHNAQQATDFRKQTNQAAQALKRLDHAIEDIERNGPRVLALSPSEFADEWQKRLSNLEAVNAAMRVYNGLGATDASQRLEARITGALGAPGHGWFMGANLDVLKNIRAELVAQHDVRLNTAKRSDSGNSRPLAPVLGGPRSQPQQGGGTEGGTWIAIPSRLANQPKYKGKSEIQVDAEGRVLGSR